jgi:hypothetical protein
MLSRYHAQGSWLFFPAFLQGAHGPPLELLGDISERPSLTAVFLKPHAQLFPVTKESSVSCPQLCKLHLILGPRLVLQVNVMEPRSMGFTW